jgi:cytochrome bd-type quinol oxidase subunit 2
MGRLSLVYTSRRRMESSHSRAAWLNSTYTHTHREKDGRETTTMTTAPSCVYSFPAFCFFFLLLFSHLFIAESCRREKKKKSLSFFFVVCLACSFYIYIFSLFWPSCRDILGSCWACRLELLWAVSWAGRLGLLSFSLFCFLLLLFLYFAGVFWGGGWKKKGEMAGRLDGWMDEGKVEDPPRRGFG